jgi:hypothetical protein
MPENLLRKNWDNLDFQELRSLLQQRIDHRPGQVDRAAGLKKLYLPLAGESCRVALTFDGNKIVALETGPAFNAAEWEGIADEIENGVLAGSSKVGREYSFSSFRVTGSWRGPLSGVQILPPPPEAPVSPFTEHPFILEFPIIAGPEVITKHRRIREHRRLTLLLNVLLSGRISCQSNRSEHFWALIPIDRSGWLHRRRVGRWLRLWWKKAQSLFGRTLNDDCESRWVQRYFSGPLDAPVSEALSPSANQKIVEVDPEAYYTNGGMDGSVLRVPADLDDSLCRYRDLDAQHRAKFDRATFWLDLASRQWTTSVSASFASLVSAVESLTDRGITHHAFCGQCQKSWPHEVPGPTEKFRSFFDTYAPGAALSERRSSMYGVRSAILHGSDLLLLDQDLAFGFDPTDFNQRELHHELWSITRLALRNWLRSPT